VRYRYNPVQRKHDTTVELIIDEGPWEPPAQLLTPDTIVYLRVAWGEAAIARQIKAAGGQWRRDYTLRAIRYGQAERLDLLDRMVDPPLQ
jgi:hypothetical protein